jgi:hypothetical protein
MKESPARARAVSIRAGPQDCFLAPLFDPADISLPVSQDILMPLEPENSEGHMTFVIPQATLASVIQSHD